jgi:hypothetical protein
MADTKISALPASTTPLAGTEVLPIVQAGATKQVSVANLTAGRTQTSNGIVQGTAATGYNFTSNTLGANATSQLLNFYEEGTWVPSVQFSGASVGVTYGTGGAAYTRIGNLVTCTAYIVLTSKGSSAGNLEIGGLPYTVASGANYSFGAVGTLGVTFSGSIYGLIFPATNFVRIYESTLLGVRSVVQNTAVTNSAEFAVQFSYQV